MACCQVAPQKPQEPVLRPAGEPKAIHPNLFPATPSAEGRVVSLLEAILKEQANLQDFLQQHQQHQQALTKKIDDQQSQLNNISNAMTSVDQNVTELESTVSKLATSLAAPLATGRKFAPEDSSGFENEMPGGESQAPQSQKQTYRKKVPGFVESILRNKYFDACTAAVILANMCSVLLSLHFKGLHSGFKLGLRRDDSVWIAMESRFDYMEYFYNTVFLLELSMRLGVYRRSFFRSKFNWIDATIVFLSCLDCFALKNMDISFVDLSVLRLLRVVKLLRSMESVAELRVLLRTLYCAIPAVIWSVLLVGMIIIGGGTLMCQLALQYIEDESIRVETRRWLYNNFGTSLISIYTMFVSTFTNNWVWFSRRLFDDVSYMFAVIWVLWVVMINFTTMRVVGALFLQKTMRVSELDAERNAMYQMRRKGQLAEKLSKIFRACDISGDGIICEQEFKDMLQEPDIIADFDSMGLDVDEVKSFFSVLAADDGEADYHEFINGAISMATSAPTLNHMISLQNQLRLERDVRNILDNTEHVRKTTSQFLHPRFSLVP